MRNIIAGTAGHIDHGKTALVRALTGIDTDRLEEEKRRGISIDLGFAHLALGEDTRIALIDVPGHERFIKNMLAGVGGIDLVLFVVACDESIKPQTREHLHICELLRIERGVIALTKADLVDKDIRDLVQLEVEELVRGTFLENAPIIPVSVVSGYGMMPLREALASSAAFASERKTAGFARLPVDRSFTMPGFGAVATGTLVSGAIALDDELQVYPSDRVVRVRGLQVQGEAVAVAHAGQRVALNVAGIEVSRLPRGVVLGAKGRFEISHIVDAMLEVLPGAKGLKSRAPIRMHAGTAETMGEIRSAGEISAGSVTPVRIALKDPMLLVPGDRFVARMFSPVVTIGGGSVVDVNPVGKFSPSRVERLAGAELDEWLAICVEQSAWGLSVIELARRCGVSEERIVLERGELVPAGPWLVHSSQIARIRRLVLDGLAAFHEREPLLSGQNREVLRSALCRDVPAEVFDALLAGWTDVAAAGDLLRLPSYRVVLRTEEDEAVRRIEAAFAQAGLEVPALNDVLAGSGVEARRAASLTQMLLREKKLLRVSNELVFHAEAVMELRSRLKAWGRPSFTVAEFKELTGLSRKYAIPLLEYFDRERVTRRNGDVRMVL